MSGAFTDSHPFIEEEELAEEFRICGPPTEYIPDPEIPPNGTVAACILFDFEEPFEVLGKLFEFMEKPKDQSDRLKHVVISPRAWVRMKHSRRDMIDICEIAGHTGYIGSLWGAHLWVTEDLPKDPFENPSEDKCFGYSEYATKQFKVKHPFFDEYFNKKLRG